MNIIRDDLGTPWYYDEATAHIRCVADDTEGAGYDCASFEDGVRILNELGYLTYP